MHVFLTGGTGFIGRPLAKALLARGWSITALVRRPNGRQAQALCKMGAQLFAGDITDCESMRPAMKGSDMVVHNAGQYEAGLDKAGKRRMQATNVTGTENVLGLAQELGISRTVYVSTEQAFGETGRHARDETFTRQTPCRTTYERTKTEAHRIACQYQRQGLPLIIVCPNGVIGPNDHSPAGYFVRLYVNRAMPPICWSPDVVNCGVGVNDAAEGIALAAERGQDGETYFLGGEAATLRESMSIWAKRPGGFRPTLWLPAGVMACCLAPVEPLQRMMGLPAFLSRESVAMFSTNWYFTSEKAKRELGWSHCSAEDMWFAAIDGERELLSRRKGQNLIQRLKPLENVDE